MVKKVDISDTSLFNDDPKYDFLHTLRVNQSNDSTDQPVINPYSMVNCTSEFCTENLAFGGLG